MGDDKHPSVTSNLRPLRLLDVPKWLRWLDLGKEKNGLDGRMFSYPKLKVVVHEQDGKTTLFLPFHEVMMLDSLAFDPEADAKNRLVSVRETMEDVIREAKAAGFAEIVFVSSDERTDEVAAKFFGFTKQTMFRKVL